MPVQIQYHPEEGAAPGGRMENRYIASTNNSNTVEAANVNGPASKFFNLFFYFHVLLIAAIGSETENNLHGSTSRFNGMPNVPE